MHPVSSDSLFLLDHLERLELQLSVWPEAWVHTPPAFVCKSEFSFILEARDLVTRLALSSFQAQMFPSVWRDDPCVAPQLVT